MTLLYLFCLVVGLLFTVVSAIAGHLFGGGDAHVTGSGGHAEAGADASDGLGVSAFSPTVIAVFVSAFGAFGIILSQFGPTKEAILSVPLSLVGALGTASAVLGVMRALFKRTQSSSEAKSKDMVGLAATLITAIPEGGVGEIAYVIGGTRYTAPARSEDGKAIASGQAVKITRTVAGQYFVTRN